MKLGAFSTSLTVADLDRSKAFYELLGFDEVGGNADEGWLILANDLTVIGLFHGMFDSNILTFNPGLAQDKSETDDYTDVREIQAHLDAAGVEFTERVADDNAEGPGHISFRDPDGNLILIDQFR